MTLGFLNIGGKALIPLDEIIGIFQFNSPRGMKRFRLEYQARGMLINLKGRRPGKSMVLTRSGYLYACRFKIGTLMRRLAQLVEIVNATAMPE